MSFVIYLLLLFLFPQRSLNFKYGIIRNASIKLPFDVPTNLVEKLAVQHCNNCLCTAYRNPQIHLFTCTQNGTKNVFCQFYYFWPKRDEIEYPRNDTNIYIMKENVTFEEKDDCCNTTYLINIINNTTRQQNFFNSPLRSIVLGDNNTIVGIDTTSVLKFDKQTYQRIYTKSGLSGLRSIGYYNRTYYLGTQNSIFVADEAFTTISPAISGLSATTAIRFVNDTYMVVGVGNAGVRIYTKDANGLFTKLLPKQPAVAGGQVHAIGVVDETAFYVGWDDTVNAFHLYKNYGNDTWLINPNDTISFPRKTSDIFIDDCQRVWTIEARTKNIFIYDHNQTNSYILTTPGLALFNLLILENYTLVMSHENSDGLSVIQPPLNCRPRRIKNTIN